MQHLRNTSVRFAQAAVAAKVVHVIYNRQVRNLAVARSQTSFGSAAVENVADVARLNRDFNTGYHVGTVGTALASDDPAQSLMTAYPVLHQVASHVGANTSSEVQAEANRLIIGARTEMYSHVQSAGQAVQAASHRGYEAVEAFSRTVSEAATNGVQTVASAASELGTSVQQRMLETRSDSVDARDIGSPFA